MHPQRANSCPCPKTRPPLVAHFCVFVNTHIHPNSWGPNYWSFEARIVGGTWLPLLLHTLREYREEPHIAVHVGGGGGGGLGCFSVPGNCCYGTVPIGACRTHTLFSPNRWLT